MDWRLAIITLKRVGRTSRPTVSVLLLATQFSGIAGAQTVDLGLTAPHTANVGDLLSVDVFAFAPSPSSQTFTFAEVILEWDASRLQLAGAMGPCSNTPCPPNTYLWLDIGFPVPSPEDLNEDLTDGDAMLWAVAQFPPNEPPRASAQGLWMVRLSFQTLAPGPAWLRVVENAGLAQTRIVDGALDITGDLGPAVQVALVRCPVPIVEAIGSRYLLITPADQPEAIALRINGPPVDQNVNCLSLYVQANGSVGRSPAAQTPAKWGSVPVTGVELTPGATFDVRTDCSEAHGVFTLSEPISIRLWNFGDVTGDSMVSTDDVLLVKGAVEGHFPPGTRPEQIDVAPCTPDGVIDALDVAEVENAREGGASSCPSPCLRVQWLSSYRQMNACLTGPAALNEDCTTFDFDQDGDVDLHDCGVFQREFGGVDPPL